MYDWLCWVFNLTSGYSLSLRHTSPFWSKHDLYMPCLIEQFCFQCRSCCHWWIFHWLTTQLSFLHPLVFKRSSFSVVLMLIKSKTMSSKPFCWTFSLLSWTKHYVTHPPPHVWLIVLFGTVQKFAPGYQFANFGWSPGYLFIMQSTYNPTGPILLGQA